MSALSVMLCNCFALRQATRRITRLYEKRLSSVGLTAAQFCILTVVDDSHSIGLAELADVLGMERTSLLRALRPLERENWIATTAGPERRKHRLSLTPAGKRQRQRADPHWRAAQDEFEQHVGRLRASSMRQELLALPL